MNITDIETYTAFTGYSKNAPTRDYSLNSSGVNRVFAGVNSIVFLVVLILFQSLLLHMPVELFLKYTFSSAPTLICCQEKYFEKRKKK